MWLPCPGLGFACEHGSRFYSIPQRQLSSLNHSVIPFDPAMWRPGAWNNPASPPPVSPLPLHSNQSSSPLPGRRPGPGGRPPLTHRTSSLSLASSTNASTTSLSGSLRGQNPQNPGPRRAATIQIPSGIRDPLDVLEGILGVQLKPGTEADDHEDGEVPDLGGAEDIDFGGLSLEEFVQKEERQEAEDRELQIRARNHSVNTLVDCGFRKSYRKLPGESANGSL